MSVNVVKLDKPRRLPADLPDLLRQMATDVESGRLQDVYIGYSNDEGEYGFILPSSYHDTLVLAALMYDYALSKYRK